MLTLTAPPSGPFDINELQPGRQTGARFPVPDAAYKGYVLDTHTYLDALHASMGEVGRQVESSLLEVVKALGVPPSAYSFATMSSMPDPSNAGLMPWPGIAPESLQKVCRENIAPQLVIRNRVGDLARYSGLSSRIWEPGWQIGMRRADDAPGEEDRNAIREAERFVWNCNRETAYSDARERDAHNLHPFDMFLRTFGDNTHTYDGWSVWTDMDRAGRIKAFANLPAGNIRLAIPGRGYQGNPRLFAALVDDTGNPVQAFTRDQMFWSVRNPRSDPSTWGYGHSEVEIAIRMVQAFQGGIDLNADAFARNCYVSDTEVLTKNGWRKFDEVKAFDDEFATLNTETGAFEYQQATDHTWGAYEGEVYWMKSRCVDLIVTPEHRIVTQFYPDRHKPGRGDYTVTKASDMYALFQSIKPRARELYGLPMVSKWTGVEVGEKFFKPSVHGPQRPDFTGRMSGDDYCAFMGMYLSEGNTRKHDGIKDDARSSIVIHQKEKSKGFDPFRQVISRITAKSAAHYCDGFHISWKALAEHVASFGGDCYSKRVPQDILDATPRQLKIFWDYYSLGDGCVQYPQTVNSKRPHRHESIATTSKLMADQLQEVAQKMGVAATIHTQNTSNTTHVCGKKLKSSVHSYAVHLKSSTAHCMDMEKADYTGMVGCVTVPNGTLYVRRKGKAAWCGNSIPNGMLLLMGDFFNQSQIDALMREWTNMKRGQSKVWGFPVMSVPEGAKVEVLDFMDMKGQELRYKDHMNLMGGLYCAISLFPSRRLGLFTSGNTKDNAPLPNESTEVAGVDDPGLPPLLGFVANRMNEYLIWPNWPRLKLWFNGASPKQDAREYEARKLARTWGEARNDVDLPALTAGVPAKNKPLMEVMSLCPEDPAKSGVFQTLATKWLEMQAGAEGDGGEGGEGSDKDTKKVGAPFPSKTDPAESQSHGHRSGVRRDSAAEAASAEAST
jgi:hypothetical protein